MESSKKKTSKSINQLIADIVKCHPVYVCRVLTGDVPANKGKALKIVEAAHLIRLENDRIATTVSNALNAPEPTTADPIK